MSTPDTPPTGSERDSPSHPRLVLHLVLTHHWYDETVSGRKSIEYRKINYHWRRLIWSRRNEITHVRFARGYTKTTATYEVEKIDTGLCPIPGWNGRYFRIHFKPNATDHG